MEYQAPELTIPALFFPVLVHPGTSCMYEPRRVALSMLEWNSG